MDLEKDVTTIVADPQGSWVDVAMESGSMVLWEIAADAETVRYSGTPAILRRMGFTGGGPIQTLTERFEHIHPADADIVRSNIARTIATGEPYEVEYRVFGQDGERWLIARGRRMDEGPAIMRGVLFDITDRQRRDIALREAEDRFKAAFASAPIGMGLHDRDGRWLQVNPALCALLGYCENELLSMSILEMTHPDDRALHVELEQELIAGTRPSYRVAKRYLHADGRTVWSRVSIAGAHSDGALQFVAQFEDITDAVQHEQELQRLALVDELTGLHNRRALLTLGAHMRGTAAREGSGVAILFLDLDGLKRINDSFGHHAGDAALREFAEILRAVFRRSDIISRLGGDEFCVLQMAVPGHSLRRSHQRLIEALDERNRRNTTPYELHASAGFAMLEPSAAEDLDDAIDRADAEMYVQKKGRRAHGRLLVVEDEPSLQSLIGVVLHEDADVSFARSVEEAYDMLAFKKVDAVIADLHLPGASGLDMVVAMRERADTANIPILVLTGGDDDRIEERCLAAGADDFLTKPFDPEVLRWRTRRLLERRNGR